MFRNLVADARQHGLVLFVGSGINARAVPQWGALLTRLVTSSLSEASMEDERIKGFAVSSATECWQAASLEIWSRNHFDVCGLASIAKAILGPERFRLEIQDTLYEGGAALHERLACYCKKPSQEDSVRFAYLRAVGRLCSLPQVRAVATFNYDTLLETAIKAVGLKTPWSYFGKTGSMPNVGVPNPQFFPVFHLHGLLSPPEALFRNSEESAVLAYDEYFDRNADPLSWETATPIHFMRNFCTLWLGASLRDWNMLRLLHAARSGGGAPPSYCLLCLEEVKRELAFQLPRPVTASGPLAEGEFLRQCATFYAAWNKFEAEAKNFQGAAMRLQATLLERVGVQLIVSGEGFVDIPETLEQSIILPLRPRVASCAPTSQKGS